MNSHNLQPIPLFNMIEVNIQGSTWFTIWNSIIISYLIFNFTIQSTIENQNQVNYLNEVKRSLEKRRFCDRKQIGGGGCAEVSDQISGGDLALLLILDLENWRRLLMILMKILRKSWENLIWSWREDKEEFLVFLRVCEVFLI